MVSCGFVHIWCVTTACFFLFCAPGHPYIPLHFEEMIFHLFLMAYDNTPFSDVHECVEEITVET